MKPHKKTFYPVELVEKELKNVPKEHLSERVNELIPKGLSVEKQQQVTLDYQKYNAALDEPKNTKNQEPIVNLMGAKAFEPEDEDFV